MDALRPFLSRGIGLLVGWLVGQAALRYGVTVPDEVRDYLIDGLNTMVGVLGTYFLTHRTLDKKLNPADTASSHLAAEGKVEARAIKVAEQTAARTAAFGAADPLEEPPRRLYRPPHNED
jgi:hypothetical protein